MLLAVAALCLCGCADKFRQVRITSAGVESVTPDGLRSFSAVVSLGVDNPAAAFTLKDLRADVMYDSVAVMHLAADVLAVEGRTEKVYTLPVAGTLASGMNVLQLLDLAGRSSLDEYSLRIRARAVVAGVGKDLAYDDIPLTGILGNKQ